MLRFAAKKVAKAAIKNSNNGTNKNEHLECCY